MYEWGCSRCSVACILSNICGSEVDPRNIPVNSDYYVSFSNIPACKIIYSNIGYIELAVKEASKKEQLDAIINSIDRNYPVIVRVLSGINTHFIVAYGYINNGNQIEDILTFDTIYPNDREGKHKYGEEKNLKRVMALNFSGKSAKIYGVFTYHEK